MKKVFCTLIMMTTTKTTTMMKVMSVPLTLEIIEVCLSNEIFHNHIC